MTAEIVVLNKSAAALAADSAVIIGRGSSSKIYNSVNKIFELHNTAPVGIMVYGSLNFMGLPIETLIKEYRANIASVTFDRISEYKNSFIDYLAKNVPSTKDDEVNVVAITAINILEEIDEEIGDKILSEIRNTGQYKKSKDNNIAKDIISHKLVEIKKNDRMKYATREYQKAIESLYGSIY